MLLKEHKIGETDGEKISILDFTQIQSAFSSKGIVKKIKRQVIEREVFINHVIHKELLHIDKTNNPIAKWRIRYNTQVQEKRKKN